MMENTGPDKDLENKVNVTPLASPASESSRDETGGAGGVHDPSGNQDGEKEKRRVEKHHLIKPKWLRIILKTLMWIIIFILLIPVLLYIPPVQTFVKNIATKIVYNSTGMKVTIEKFRLKFPLDVSLQGVTVLDVAGDTMVNAKEALLDVKVMPLLALDVQLNKLQLREGYYRMVSPDSSMIINVRAGLLNADDKSFANIKTGEISLNEALLKDGSLQLYMNVWKQQPTPTDTATSTPFLIKANDLKLENFSFGMSMLPTIDTLFLKAGNINLQKGVVDLGKNEVSWKLASVADGSGVYQVPTPEWIAAHPAPPPTPSTGPPMIIKGDSISLDRFGFIYATKGATPLPGFDAQYIEVSDIGMGMKNFYNASSTVRLPITRLEAKERSGLQIVSGKGEIGVDESGLSLKDLTISTLYSYLRGSAGIPFALMELKPDAPVDVNMEARIGMPDVDSFMPSLKEYTSYIPARVPLEAGVEASGTLSAVDIDRLDIELRDILSLSASGYADNPLDIKKLEAEVEFDGVVADPTLIDKFTGQSGIKVPALTLKGEASAFRENYSADFTLRTTAGDLAAKGKVGMNSEKYNVDASIRNLNVAHFMPDLGIGKVTGTIKADGRGFNPLSGKSVTTAEVNVQSIEYNKRLLSDIRARLTLAQDGNFDLYAISPNPSLDFDIDGTGSIHTDDYKFDLTAHLRDIDLEKLGLSPTMNNGKGTIYINGTASPDRWLYAADLKLVDFDWNLPNQYIHLPGGLTARVDAEENSTSVKLDTHQTTLSFASPTGLKMLTEAFTKVGEIVGQQMSIKNLEVDKISEQLPPFTLDMNASGKGLLNQFLVPQGMSLDTIYGKIYKDSLLRGDIEARNFTSSAADIDTLSLILGERRNLLDYKIHMGNRPGTLDEFAQVNLNGYVGGNRLGAFLTQKNISGKTGYRLGLTAALADSVVTVHFTPLKSTIAYLPWTLNDDNYVDYNLYTSKINANLLANSAESSILMKTQQGEGGFDELHLKLDNIHIQDFLSMSITAPPITGDLNSDLRVMYDGDVLRGKGTLGIKKLTYEKTQIGDFDLDLRAGRANNGDSGIAASMLIDGSPAMTAFARLRTDSVNGLTPDSLGLNLTRFPLSIANPFLGDMVKLGGRLNGKMIMDGTFTKPILNGELSFDTVTVKIPMADATLTFDRGPVVVDSSVVVFNKLKIFGVNNNPLTLDGTVNARSFSNILLNLSANASNWQLLKSDKRSKADIFGKLFVDLDASVKGSLSLMDIRANLNILGSTDITYRLNTAPAELTSSTDNNVVKFVNFNDTTQVANANSLAATSSMRIRAGLTVSPGTQATVLLSSNGTDRVELEPTAQLNYFQNYMGDMRLNGTFTLGNGFARYALPVIGEKKFTFNPSSTVTWGGDLMNPVLNITATDELKANVTQGGNSRLANFLVTLKATGTLSAPKVAFDLSSNDDLSLQNEIQSMSADQRQTQAMNLLLYGQYTGQNTKGNANIGGNMLYSFLESQLNSWAAKNIRGVDLSFGIDQYDKMTNGASSTETSYSYQVSKSLFNNRFKILVGGNYSTDASADENLSQNLISDISFEYILKQTETQNMSVRLFRHTGFESILEGEITETGVGFVMKRKLQNLLHLFRFYKKRKNTDPTAPMDSLKQAIENSTDTLTTKGIRKEEENEK